MLMETELPLTHCFMRLNLFPFASCLREKKTKLETETTVMEYTFQSASCKTLVWVNFDVKVNECVAQADRLLGPSHYKM